VFLISVIAFAAGIYIETLYPLPILVSLSVSTLFLCAIPLALRRTYRVSFVLMAVCFVFAGMVRLALITEDRPVPHLKEATDVYGGIITESSPNTKIVKLAYPDNLSGLSVVFRTSDNLGINDEVRIFGSLRELSLTFRNPYLVTWKWLTRLEGISYELRGAIVSVRQGRNYVEAWRNYLARNIENSGAQHSGIIKALTIGDTTGLDEDTKALFLRTGTSHILAISGSNISIVTAFFFFIARMLMRTSVFVRLRGDDTKYAALLSIPFAILFMLTAGSGIPIIRATIMITVCMLAINFERERHIENTVALSALIILILYPYSIFMPTFQLTFMSVFFIILFSKALYPYARSWHPVLKWSFSSVLITLSAMIGTLPIVLYHFYGINPFAVVHNLILVPLMCVIAMPLALVGMFVPYGAYLLRLSGDILVISLKILRALDMGYLYPIVRPNLFETICYFVLIPSLFFLRVRLVRFALILILLPAISLYSMSLIKERFYNDTISLSFIDVGLGDAILVEAPHGMRLIIDGGGLRGGDFDVGRSVLTPILLSKKILTLDYVINTHPHGDHAGGLLYIVNNFGVKHFVTGTYVSQESVYNRIVETIQRKGLHPEVWKRGDRFLFKNGMEVMVFNPAPYLSLDDLNNRSIVLKIVYGKSSFLCTGDMESVIEEQLLMLKGVPIRADVLKVPHHGSKYSSSLDFLRAVKPSIAVLSVGKGITGLPSLEALERYRLLSIPVLRTDLNGFIEMRSDGNRIVYNTYR